MRPDVVVIGAGLAGLSCARGLADAGARVRVLERARDVGGRCATRRVAGMPIDFGVLFLHASDPGVVSLFGAVEGATVLADWPARRHDTGTPCQPDAFAPEVRRFAYTEGVKALPRALARGLAVELETEVVALDARRGALHLELRGGESVEAPQVVVALALEQTRALLAGPAAAADRIRAAHTLLGLFASRAAIALLAGYPRAAPEPSWDVSYPSDSALLMLVSNESSKRRERPGNALVYQTAPRWSRAHLDDDDASITRAVLAEAEQRLGPWAARPDWTRVHRWRYARLDRGNELAAPLVLELDGGARLGVAGELFAAGGGAEAAILSGRELARRLAAEETSR